MQKALLFFICLTSCVSAEIIETNRFRDIFDWIEKDTLVVIDIDNTLIEPVQQLGSDQWFEYRRKMYREQGCAHREAIEKALPEWMAVQSMSKMKLCEEDAKEVVNELQKGGNPVICLTTRGLGLADRTVHQLIDLGVDMREGSPTQEELYFFNERGILFREGTLFTADTHKGEALMLLLDHLKLEPKKVLFINDKENHITPVEQSCNERGIDIIGLRYGVCDSKREALDPKLVEIQWREFGKILSDDEAKALLGI